MIRQPKIGDRVLVKIHHYDLSQEGTIVRICGQKYHPYKGYKIRFKNGRITNWLIDSEFVLKERNEKG